MKIIDSSYTILTPVNELDVLKRIESIGRICYKSEDKITDSSCVAFAKQVKSNNHLSVIEHVSITVKFICDRGVSHELVRHRLASFTQESTRYCNYSKDKFGNEITVIRPSSIAENGAGYDIWKQACQYAEEHYFAMLGCGYTAQQARSVLPNSLKTEIVVTANLREWLHIFDMRCDKSAHPDMRALMIPLRDELLITIPTIFEKE